ncbi:MAG: hypothetical protein E7I50_24835, partial [Klebsiella oxytoca]|nr:hypothetical protein [Klebsiella oxytoca]
TGAQFYHQRLAITHDSLPFKKEFRYRVDVVTGVSPLANTWRGGRTTSLRGSGILARKYDTFMTEII